MLKPIIEVLKPGSVVYLAGPIARLGVDEAAKLHLDCMIELIAKSYAVFSPLMNSYPAWKRVGEQFGAWWERLEERMIAAVDCVVFITIPELLGSEGCLREYKYATWHKKPVALAIPTRDGWLFLMCEQSSQVNKPQLEGGEQNE